MEFETYWQEHHPFEIAITTIPQQKGDPDYNA